MKKCKHCGIRIMDDTQICPLCRGVLSETEESSQTVEAVGYPNVKQETRWFKRISRVLLFVLLALELLLIFINYMTYDSVPKLWSALTGGVIVYIYMTLWEVLGHRAGHIRVIYNQIFVVMGLLILADISMDWTGWSLEFGLPGVIYGLVLAILICMIINSSRWQSYVLMQLAAVLLSIVDVLLHFAGIAHHIALAWLALLFSVLLWSGTMIIGDRKARIELKRKLHI